MKYFHGTDTKLGKVGKPADNRLHTIHFNAIKRQMT